MNNPIITTEKLSKSFSTQGLQQHVLKNLDFEVYEQDFTVIMGPSGAGKSTLLYALSGMDKPTLGQVRFSGETISGYSADKLAVFRRKHCGFIFQQIFLIESMSLMDNVMASGRLLRTSRKELVSQAKNLFGSVKLDEKLWKKFPNQVSGGEAQRAGIVRALINNPSVVFADEPTGALNSSTGEAVLDVLSAVNQNGQSIVMVTHDTKSAIRGNRVVYLKDGVLCGELELGRYCGVDEKRRMRLHEFLTQMGW